MGTGDILHAVERSVGVAENKYACHEEQSNRKHQDPPKKESTDPDQKYHQGNDAQSGGDRAGRFLGKGIKTQPYELCCGSTDDERECSDHQGSDKRRSEEQEGIHIHAGPHTLQV